MELGLTQTQLKVRDLARDFAQHELASKAKARDLEHTFPADMMGVSNHAK